jgi:hypothetical protein
VNLFLGLHEIFFGEVIGGEGDENISEEWHDSEKVPV